MLYMFMGRKNGCPIVRFERSRMQVILKRTLDLTCAITGLVLSSPLFLVIYVMLKLQGQGSVIFKQERIGKGGNPFFIYKFRTMRVDAEAQGPQLAVKDDKRLTPVGKFLREHHLDELPQLWNVLQGDMAMVGPRPERQYFIDQIMKEDPRYIYILKVKPGVTSEATLYNGYTSTMEKMLERLNMDLKYIEEGTVSKDISIMLKTAKIIAFGDKNK